MMKRLCYIAVLGLSILVGQLVLAAPSGSERLSHLDYTQNNEVRNPEHRRKSHDGQHRSDRSNLQAGSTLPTDFRIAERQVDYNTNPNLSEPSRYQQWVKVRNKYVLLNVLTNTVIKVVPENASE